VSVEPLIEARGIVNRFGAQLVHDDLDLEVMAGEIFGIVGGSGSGKSVLLNTILGLRRPQAGMVRIQGTDITRLDDAALRELKTVYGVTFQAGALFSSLTVLQNVQLPMLEHLELSPRALEELAMLKVRLVGLPPEAAWKYPAQLSGGARSGSAAAVPRRTDVGSRSDRRRRLR
jgi:phospholipid/cholesterol/gamma-HCH transport system ATP-binding protein